MLREVHDNAARVLLPEKLYFLLEARRLLQLLVHPHGIFGSYHSYCCKSTLQHVGYKLMTIKYHTFLRPTLLAAVQVLSKYLLPSLATRVIGSAIKSDEVCRELVYHELSGSNDKGNLFWFRA